MEPLTLEQLREDLLHLHKLLLAYQQKQYEGKYGRIGSPGELFKLVTQHGDFAWLRQLSELIVGIDELLEHQERDGRNRESLLLYTRQLLAPSGTGEGFAKLYFHAIQQDPAVAVAHGRVWQLLKET